jgi:tetratricopeptide (TPR) repeat protein
VPEAGPVRAGRPRNILTVADTRIDELRRRLERDPGSRLFAQLAEELRKGGELAEAIRVARNGLAQHSTYASARLTLGRALLDSGDVAGARVELERALRDAPDNILASRFLGQALEAVGELKGALVQYQKTLTMAPGDRQIQGQIAALEARLRAPAGAEAVPAAPAAPEAQTVPPTRALPPPLPAGGARPSPAGEPSLRPGSSPPPVIAPAARPLATAAPAAGAEPPRPARAAAAGNDAPLASGGEEDFSAEPELPATLRIRSSQAPPPAHPSPEPIEPAPLLAIQPLEPEPPEAPTPAAETTAPFSSSTLAELYFQQGLVDRAVDVYRQLVTQEPDNDRARMRLAELERAEPSEAARAARRQELQRTIAGLEALLAVVRRR